MDEEEEDDDDDSQFSAPMIDGSYLRAESQHNGAGFSQSGRHSQYQNEPIIKESNTSGNSQEKQQLLLQQ